MFLSASTRRLLADLLNEWAIQLLVLFSFALQVFLLTFASIRRHKVSVASRLFLWLAYQLADSTALFTLGHLSISSGLKEHELVAFWAPLLLVHLGGQDTITAYSAEDNGIWLRHLQTLLVQVSGAAYVLYRYIPGSETLVIAASILIFVVGVLKYAERIWALYSASMDSIWSSLDRSDASSNVARHHDTTNDDALLGTLLSRRHGLGVEEVLMAAHGLLDVCKGLFIGLRRAQRGSLHDVVASFKMCGRLDELMEMELSLMYDIMYTKAVVVHTRYGCCVRVVAPLATVMAFLLFLLAGKEKYERRDIVISYVLLVGAMVLEAVSVVRAVGSTWTAAWLYDRKWHRLHGELRALRQVIGAAEYRRWSGSVGQYNLLLSCAQGNDKDPPKLLGLRHVAEWWAGQPTKLVSPTTKELVLRELLRIAKQSKETRSTGAVPGLLTLQLYDMDELAGWSVEEFRFEDSIIAWHVATEICLFEDRSGNAVLVDATRLLSNYMMFLLVRCPYMLPGPVSHSPCYHVRKALCGLMDRHADQKSQGGAAGTPEKRRLQWAHTGLHDLCNTFDAPDDEYDHAGVRPDEYDHAGVRLADMLYHRHNRLEVIFGVWVEMLCYVADHCSRESHTRQLCRGGELVTIVWLMARHAEMYYS